MTRILAAEVQNQHGVVAARQRAREIAALLGFGAQDQTRIATAVSEIARNAVEYGKGGSVQFFLAGDRPPQSLLTQVADRGPGIANLQDILDGQYRSKTGMGLGIIGSQRLVDRFEIESSPETGTTVSLYKTLPGRDRTLTPRDLARIAEELASSKPRAPIEELEHQNRELLSTLDQLRNRSEELARVNHELEDTNRGVVALYAELDEKANHLRRADELKSQFLSNMSHEFRTPVFSTVSLCKILLDRSDGELTEEQERQVSLILRAQEGLAELVNNLLDLAKVEAGKSTVNPSEFSVEDLFSALRGMFRPMPSNPHVALIFDDPPETPPLISDEGKISQILRNFISNALKFTEEGEVRVGARYEPAADEILFTVTDSGIGISPEDRKRIFEEFGQVDSRLQRKVKGTGLGLPLSRKLSELLGGTVSMVSEPGVGSTFTACIPRVFPELKQVFLEPSATPALDPLKYPVLAVEESTEKIIQLDKYLQRSGFQLIPAQTLEAARSLLRKIRPAAILLDLPAGADAAWEFLSHLKKDPATRGIPALVTTSAEQEHKALAFGADGICPLPVDRKAVLSALCDLVRDQPVEKVLLIDDEEISRYVARQFLSETRLAVLEASDGEEGIRLAQRELPRAILLDLSMPGMSGFEVLRVLKGDSRTRDIAVIVQTSRTLAEEDRQRLRREAIAVLSKGEPPDQSGDTIRRLLADQMRSLKK